MAGPRNGGDNKSATASAASGMSTPSDDGWAAAAACGAAAECGGGQAGAFDALPPELLARIIRISMCGQDPAGCELRLICRTWQAHHDAACTSLKLGLRLTADPCDTSSLNPGAVHPLRLPSLLQQFQQLRRVDLAGSTLEADSLQALSDGLPHLCTLCLIDCQGISDDGILDLSKTCTTLTSLTLRGCVEFTYVGCLHLDGLTGLTSLDLFGTLSTPHGWWLQPAPRFLSIQALTHLDLTQTPVPEETLRGLIVLTKLTSLELVDCPHVTDATMAVLGRLPMLAKLSLAFTRVTEEGLRELEGHGTLTELDLSDTDTITSAGVQALKRVPALSTLRLKGYSNVGNLELEWMAMLPALTELDLTNNHDLSDDALASLARMSRLRELHLLGFSHVSMQRKRELERNLPHLAIHIGPAHVLM